MDFRVLELFSGIGGMHYAFQYSELPGQIVAAMDINTVANSVYAHNHPATPVNNRNIQSLDAKTIEKLGVNMLVMSPPCQPHTRVGNRLDVADSRSDALQHLCNLLPQCTNLCYVLMENVKGFEMSEARQRFVTSLKAAGFYYCELILSPAQFHIPNSRHRYYCLARRYKFPFPTDHILEEVPVGYHSNIKTTLIDILQPDSSIPAETYMKDKDLLKRINVMDIVTRVDTNTMCFTKAYTHYAEGTGSVYTPLLRSEVNKIFESIKCLDASGTEGNERLELLQSLRLRYFTPKEVSRLMNFPDTFSFPQTTTNRQKYRLLGNSINVFVVSQLLKLLCTS